MRRKADPRTFLRWSGVGLLALWVAAAVAPTAAGQGSIAAFYESLPTVDTAYLRIEWSPQLVAQLADSKNTVPSRKLAAKACAALGEALRVGQGPWGRGLFVDYGCYIDARRQAKAVAGSEAKSPPLWLLRPVQSDGELALQVYYRPRAGADFALLAASAAIPATAWTQDLLRDPGYAALTAALVLDALLESFGVITAFEGEQIGEAAAKGQHPQRGEPSCQSVFLARFVHARGPPSLLNCASAKGARS